jgi:hypothetical protein
VARTALTPQRLGPHGVLASYVTPDASGISFRSSGRQFVHIKNASGSSITVTETIGRTIQGQAVTAPTSTIAAGAERFYGPYPDDYEQQDGTDNVYLGISSVTSVTVACLTL